MCSFGIDPNRNVRGHSFSAPQSSDGTLPTWRSLHAPIVLALLDSCNTKDHPDVAGLTRAQLDQLLTQVTGERNLGPKLLVDLRKQAFISATEGALRRPCWSITEEGRKELRAQAPIDCTLSPVFPNALCLLALWQREGQLLSGTLPLEQIGKQLGYTSSGVARVAQGLMMRGLVELDEHRNALRLTVRGMEFVQDEHTLIGSAAELTALPEIRYCHLQRLLEAVQGGHEALHAIFEMSSRREVRERDLAAQSMPEEVVLQLEKVGFISIRHHKVRPTPIGSALMSAPPDLDASTTSISLPELIAHSPLFTSTLIRASVFGELGLPFLPQDFVAFERKSGRLNRIRRIFSIAEALGLIDKSCAVPTKYALTSLGSAVALRLPLASELSDHKPMSRLATQALTLVVNACIASGGLKMITKPELDVELKYQSKLKTGPVAVLAARKLVSRSKFMRAGIVPTLKGYHAWRQQGIAPNAQIIELLELLHTPEANPWREATNEARLFVAELIWYAEDAGYTGSRYPAALVKSILMGDEIARLQRVRLVTQDGEYFQLPSVLLQLRRFFVAPPEKRELTSTQRVVLSYLVDEYLAALRTGAQEPPHITTGNLVRVSGLTKEGVRRGIKQLALRGFLRRGLHAQDLKPVPTRKGLSQCVPSDEVEETYARLQAFA